MPFNNIRSNSGQTILPKAKASNLVVQKVEKDLLVYDMVSNKAHHLNKTLSLVWQKCDGLSTFADIQKILEIELKTEIEADFIWLALTELEKSNLLEEDLHKEDFETVTRRSVLFKYALPSVIMPIAISLVAPRAVSAQSCAPGLGAAGAPCSTDPECCPGLFCMTPVGGVIPGTCQPL